MYSNPLLIWLINWRDIVVYVLVGEDGLIYLRYLLSHSALRLPILRCWCDNLRLFYLFSKLVTYTLVAHR